MKAGRTLDSKIAAAIMGLKLTDIKNIPHYSTNIYDAYNIISFLQTQGWACYVGSNISQNGSLTYKVQFSKNGLVGEGNSPSIPMSICSAALNIIEEKSIKNINSEYNEKPINIIGTPKKPGFYTFELENKELEELIAKELDNFKLPSINNLTFRDILIESDFEKMPKSLADFLLEILQKNHYTIFRKID